MTPRAAGGGARARLAISEAGPAGPSGNRGALDTYASVPVVEAAAQARRRAGEPSCLAPGADLAAIARAAGAGDTLALDVLAEAGALLGAGVATLLNLFNPSLVVIGGRLALAGEHVLEPVRRVVRAPPGGSTATPRASSRASSERTPDRPAARAETTLRP